MKIRLTRRSVLAFTLSFIFLISITLWLYSFLVSKTLVSVKIGNLLPLNLNLMSVANKMKNGIELAREDLLEKYKGNLAIEIHNVNGCYEQDTIPAVQKFIHDGVSIIGTSFCLFGHIPILPLTEANKIITFNTAANPDVVLNKRFAFSTNTEVKQQAMEMATFAYSKLSSRKSVFMHLDTPFGRDYHKYFARKFESLGGQLLFNIPVMPNGTVDAETIIKIKDAKPDVIVTAHFGVPLGLFIKQVRTIGITAPILANYEGEDSDVLDAAGIAAEGMIFHSPDSDVKSSTTEKFEKRYIRRFGVRPDVITTNSYDAIVLGVESYLECHGDRECMRDYIYKIKEYDGVSGAITIKSNGATDKPSTFKIIKNRTPIPFQSTKASK